MDKDHLNKMAQMPLDDSSPNDKSENDDLSKENLAGKSGIRKALKGVLTLFLIFPVTTLFAQSNSEPLLDSYTLFFIIVGAVILVSILVLVVAIYLLLVMQTLLTEQQQKKAEVEGIKFVAQPGWWQKLQTSLTDTVPLEKEATILLDHEYDGIRELDNHLPPWWRWLFYASIVWGALYLFSYHVIGIFPLQAEEYANEMAAADAQMETRQTAENENSGPVLDENSVEANMSAEALADGEKVYQMNCAACHKPDGSGLIGPNFTDEYWLHGGGIKNIYKVVKYGVIDKGMIPWEAILSPEQMQNVASYILTLAGTNPPGAKAAQGELWVPDEIEMPADSIIVEQAML